MSKSVAIGIDLGTTYCCMAVVQDGNAMVIENIDGQRTTPSWITFTESDTHIGKISVNLFTINVKNTIHSVKRLIGRKYNDPIVQHNMKYLPFKIVEDNSNLKIEVTRGERIQSFYPEQLTAILLSYLKFAAEDHLSKDVHDAVITVPANFNNAQRQATKLAAELAGLNVLSLLNEPTAASIAYDIDKNKNQHILLYDLGGGTFDVSIIQVNKGISTVKAVAGDTNLGGENFNQRLVDHFVKEFEKQHGICIKDDPKAVAKLHMYCEETKRALSKANNYPVHIADLSKDKTLNFSITRECFNNMNLDLFKKTIEIVEQSLTDAGLSKSDIDKVVMVGGSSRIPKVKSLLQEFFGDNMNLHKNINPDEAVAIGAAITAKDLQDLPEGSRMTHADVTPLSLGVSAWDNDIRNFMSVLIKKNTKIPVNITKIFNNCYDNQSEIIFPIYEGENRLATNNNLLGEFKLYDITKGPKTSIKFDVTFDLDVNGILTVHAKERNTNNEKQIKINQNWVRSDDEIKQMVRETITYQGN